MHRRAFFLALVTAVALHASIARADTFDLVTFRAPDGWTKTTSANGLQLAITDGKTGEYALAVITPAIASSASADDNFGTVWTTAVKATVTVSKPTMQPRVKKQGWDLVTGGSEFTNGATKGVALQITATGYGKTTSLIVMTNTSRFQSGIEALIGSLDLGAPTAGGSTTTKDPLAGRLWENSTSETFITGAMKGYNTGGYSTTSYTFNSDGTYRYTSISASAWVDTNQLEREAGTYTVSGSQLTITPTRGTSEEWNLVGGPIKVAAMSDVEIKAIKRHWGTRLKSSPKKRDKATYTFSFELQSHNQTNALILKSADGRTQAFLYETAPDKAVPIPKE